MKKIILIVFLLLSGCMVNYGLDEVSSQIKELAKKEISYKYSNNKKYYSYFLDASLNLKYSDDLSSIITYLDEEISLNVNTSTIINNKYYQGNNEANIFDKPILEIKDSYINFENKSLTYHYQVFEIENKYLIKCSSDEIDIISYIPKSKLKIISNKIILLLKSSKVDQNEVLKDYSLKTIITNKKEKVDLFKLKTPSSITLEELLKNSNSEN